MCLAQHLPRRYERTTYDKAHLIGSPEARRTKEECSLSLFQRTLLVVGELCYGLIMRNPNEGQVENGTRGKEQRWERIEAR